MKCFADKQHLELERLIQVRRLAYISEELVLVPEEEISAGHREYSLGPHTPRRPERNSAEVEDLQISPQTITGRSVDLVTRLPCQDE